MRKTCLTLWFIAHVRLDTLGTTQMRGRTLATLHTRQMFLLNYCFLQLPHTLHYTTTTQTIVQSFKRQVTQELIIAYKALFSTTNNSTTLRTNHTLRRTSNYTWLLLYLSRYNRLHSKAFKRILSCNRRVDKLRSTRLTKCDTFGWPIDHRVELL